MPILKKIRPLASEMLGLWASPNACARPDVQVDVSDLRAVCLAQLGMEAEEVLIDPVLDFTVYSLIDGYLRSIRPPAAVIIGDVDTGNPELVRAGIACQALYSDIVFPTVHRSQIHLKSGW